MVTSKQLRDIFRERLKKQNTTYSIFAKRNGINASSLGRFLKGASLDFENHVKLCEILNIAPDGSDQVELIPKENMIPEITKIIQNDSELSEGAKADLTHLFVESYVAMHRFQNRTK